MANILPNSKKLPNTKKREDSKVFRVGAVLIQHIKTPAGVQNNFKSSFMGNQWNAQSLQLV